MLIYEKMHSRHKNLFFIRPQENFRYGKHLHLSVECFICLRGAATAAIGDSSHALRSGQAALIFPNQIHSYATQTPSRLLAIMIPLDITTDIALSIKGRMPKHPVFEPSPALMELIGACTAKAETFDITASGSESAALHADSLAAAIQQKALAYLLFSEFFAGCELEEVTEKRADILPWVFSYVQENFASDITLRGIAAACGYEYCYLSKILKQCTGMKFMSFLNGHRVNCAKHLLRNTELSISDVAMRSGFNTLRSFNRAFLRETEQTPREYRRFILPSHRRAEDTDCAGDKDVKNAAKRGGDNQAL